MGRQLRHFATAAVLVVATTLIAPPPSMGAPTWQPISDLSAAGNDALNPQVAVDSAGNATAVWSVQVSGNGGTIQSATRPAGGTWTTPTDVSAPNLFARDPQIAVDPVGNATVVWLEQGSDIFAPAIVKVATRLASDAWSSPTELGTTYHNARSPQVAVDPDGNATAIWTGTAYIVQAASRPAGGTWTTPTDLGRGSHTHPRIAFDPDGNATAIWEGWNGIGGTTVQTATRPVGGSWSSTTHISAPGSISASPSVAVDSAGNATAIWTLSSNSYDRVQTAARPAGGTWTTPTDLSAGGQATRFPQVAVDEAGNVTAIWVRWKEPPLPDPLMGPISPGSDYFVQTATRLAGGSWTTPTDISEPGETVARARIVVDHAGNATAIWRGIYNHSDIRAATRPVGGTWTTPTDISAPDSRFGSEPQIAVDAAGNVTAVWGRFNGAYSAAQARGLDFAGPVIDTVTIPTTGTVGHSLALSVSAMDVWSSVASIAWEFGDGTTASGATVSHVWSATGTYPVKVTLTDAVGNATARSGSVTIGPAAAPTITTFKLEPARIRSLDSTSTAKKKAKVTIVLSTAAKVQLRFKGKTKAKLVRTLKAGTNTFRIKARIGAKTLKPGRYVVKASTGTSTKKAKLRIVR